MKKICLLFSMLFLLTGCGVQQSPRTFSTASAPQIKTPINRQWDPLEAILRDMTTEEKIGQLFLVAAPGTSPLSEIENYQFGGLILFGGNINGETPETLTETLHKYQSAAEIPMLIAVDEEGGTVCRVSSNKSFRSTRFLSPRNLYDDGGIELLLKTEDEKCRLLKSVGINVNLAPVCDITTDPKAFMFQRSLGQSPEATSRAIEALVSVMNRNQIGSVLKHFPGYGNNTDTHVAMAIDNRELAELEAVDLVPFQGGMDAGCGAVMVSHTIVTAMDNKNPATLSPAVHEYLREIMGFEGVIITDDLEMDAITDHYGDGEAAVLAVLAGNDLLCTWSYKNQFQAVLGAVNSGRVPIAQVNDSVIRILRWKQQLGLIE